MRRSIFVSAVALALLLIFSAPQVRADGGGTDNFTFTEQLNPSETVTVQWSLPASPCPEAPVNGIGFGTSSVPTSFFVNGTYEGTLPDQFLFWSTALGGGFIDGTLSFGLTGINAVYNGYETNPTFAPGVYTGNDPLNYGNTATLCISTPEPSSLLMLFFGILLVFGTLTLKKVQA
jgi:hypothetical protein